MKPKRIKPIILAGIIAICLAVFGVVVDGPTSASTLNWEALSPSRAIAEAKASLGDDRTRGGSSAVPIASDAVVEGDWPMVAANPQRTSWTPEEVRGKLEPIWYKPIEPYIPHKVQVIAAYDTLYISTAGGLYAIDAETGNEVWVYPTELPLGHSPTVYNGRIYVGGFDHKIHAIDAFTGQGIWTFEAGKGFQINPLVIDLEGNTFIYAGNRDGHMYAIEDHGTMATLSWEYETGGPVLFSAAYKDNAIYFASNDSHAYALTADTGELVWKSAKLPGAGFHSWWPVIYTDPLNQEDYVILAGSSNYRVALEPGPQSDIQGLEMDDIYRDNGIPEGETVAPINSDGSMEATLILEYYEQKPWRRTYFVLDADTGEEFTFNYQRRDGTTGTSYAPITWLHTRGAGNRYPPVVGSDGLLYQPMHFRYSNEYIARGGIVAWQLGDSSITTTVHANAMDEPIAYAAGGSLIFWARCNDRVAGAFDTSEPYPHWTYFSYWLSSLIPGYDFLYYPIADPKADGAVYRGAYGSVNGLYGQHGEQNPPVPYKGRVYIHRSNSIVAFGDYSGSPTGLPMAPAVSVNNANITPLSTGQLRQELSQEIQKILDTGHLRPGYLSSGLFDQRSKSLVGEYLLDYWHHPADTLYVLTLALPHLPPSQQQAVRTYLQGEYATYPPHIYTHIGWVDGEPREVFDLPPEVESDRNNFPPKAEWSGFYSGWHFPPHLFYGLWKYAQVVGSAQEIFDNSKDRLQSPPSDAYLLENPQVHNAYVAGYWGYLELEELAGYPESTDIRVELNRLLELRATQFNKDSPWLDSKDYRRVLNVARNFMYLVPELGHYLHDNALSRVQEAVDEYDYVAPYWFVAKTENMFYEGVVNPLYDYNAIFQAKALILQQDRGELLEYLDVPAFERGDLFYIQNLVAAIGAVRSLEKTAVPSFGDQGDTVTYTLSFFGNGETLTLTDTLPLGVGAPTEFELEGTSVWPTYDGSQHRLLWSDAPPESEVTIRYTVTITTGARLVLINTAELTEEGGGGPATATVTIMANPYLAYLPMILKDG